MLQDCLARTYDFPQVLASHISDIHGALPPLSSEPVLAIAHRLMTDQDGLVNAMAEDLEGIARHYGQVRDALTVEEGGVTIAQEDLKSELPSVACAILADARMRSKPWSKIRKS